MARARAILKNRKSKVSNAIPVFEEHFISLVVPPQRMRPGRTSFKSPDDDEIFNIVVPDGLKVGEWITEPDLYTRRMGSVLKGDTCRINKREGLSGRKSPAWSKNIVNDEHDRRHVDG